MWFFLSKHSLFECRWRHDHCVKNRSNVLFFNLNKRKSWCLQLQHKISTIVKTWATLSVFILLKCFSSPMIIFESTEHNQLTLCSIFLIQRRWWIIWKRSRGWSDNGVLNWTWWGATAISIVTTWWCAYGDVQSLPGYDWHHK